MQRRLHLVAAAPLPPAVVAAVVARIRRILVPKRLPPNAARAAVDAVPALQMRRLPVQLPVQLLVQVVAVEAAISNVHP